MEKEENNIKKKTYYKGFNNDMTCREFQYKEGETYSTNNAKLCEDGFHACEYPLDCFNYYNPATSVFHEVYLEDISDEKGDDSKVVAKKITIGKELSINEMVQASIGQIKSKSDSKNNIESNTGYGSVATNTGNGSVATNTGNCSSATNTGDCSVATNTGYRSAATNIGNCSVATNTGYGSVATNTGYCSAAEVKGKESIAIVTGKDSKARGALGCWLVLTERKYGYNIINGKMVKVDGKKVKENVWYTLKNGKVTEVKE